MNSRPAGTTNRFAHRIDALERAPQAADSNGNCYSSCFNPVGHGRIGCRSLSQPGGAFW